MFEKVIKVIFPTSCTICGKLYSKSICPKCYNTIKKEIKFYQIKEKRFNIFFLSFYEGKIKKLILDFKFQDSSYLYELFAELINKNAELKEIIKTYDYLVPVPMHKINKNLRGYNQTELITKKLEKEIGIKSLKCLEKVKQNKKQSLLTEKERKINVQGVYNLIDNEIKNKRILLVDDIYTTGSTAKECIKELLKAKPKKVDVLVISKSKKG